MNCYVKIHSRGSETVIGVCDENCLGQKLRQDKLRYDVTEIFFKGELIPIENAIQILKKATNFNVIGNNIINKLIELQIIHQEGVVYIDGVPIALKIDF